MHVLYSYNDPPIRLNPTAIPARADAPRQPQVTRPALPAAPPHLCFFGDFLGDLFGDGGGCRLHNFWA